jgi:hypothetical protein
MHSLAITMLQVTPVRTIQIVISTIILLVQLLKIVAICTLTMQQDFYVTLMDQIVRIPLLQLIVANMIIGLRMGLTLVVQSRIVLLMEHPVFKNHALL